jgi:hypothetical protein
MPESFDLKVYRLGRARANIRRRVLTEISYKPADSMGLQNSCTVLTRRFGLRARCSSAERTRDSLEFADFEGDGFDSTERSRDDEVQPRSGLLFVVRHERGRVRQRLVR